jgi:histidyl-tRNA synthetase
VQSVPDPAESFVIPPAAVLVAEGTAAADWTLKTAHHLRLAGVRVEMAPHAQGPTTARLRVLARDADLARGQVLIEDLATGGRQAIPADDLEATIRLRLD